MRVTRRIYLAVVVFELAIFGATLLIVFDEPTGAVACLFLASCIFLYLCLVVTR